MQLKRQSEEITKNVERARVTRKETEDLLKQEDEKIENYMLVSNNILLGPRVFYC